MAVIRGRAPKLWLLWGRDDAWDGGTRTLVRPGGRGGAFWGSRACSLAMWLRSKAVKDIPHYLSDDYFFSLPLAIYGVGWN